MSDWVTDVIGTLVVFARDNEMPHIEKRLEDAMNAYIEEYGEIGNTTHSEDQTMLPGLLTTKPRATIAGWRYRAEI